MEKYRAQFWQGRAVRIKSNAPAGAGRIGVVRHTDGENVIVWCGHLVFTCLLSREELDAL